MSLKIFRFNVFSILVGMGYLWFGYQSYLTGYWAVAMVGIVGGAVITLFSIVVVICKMLTA